VFRTRLWISLLNPTALILDSSEPVGLLTLCVVGVCAGIGVFFYGFRLLQRRRLILDTPFSKIRSASMGMVEVSGLAVGPYTVTAPITGRPCYYHRTKVWELRQGEKKKEWVQIAGECAHVPFFIDDNTGRVLVDPREADLDLHCDFKDEFSDSVFSMKHAAPDSVHGFLAGLGITASNNLRVEEYCIKPKNSLFILGTLAENPGIEVVPDAIREDIIDSPSYVPLLSVQSFAFASGSATNELGTRLVAARAAAASASSGHAQGVQPSSKIDLSMFKTPQQQKIAAALLKAGIASPLAWAKAGVPLPQPQVVKTPSPDKSDPDRFPPVVLMRGTNNGNFLISWRSQQELARSLGWKCALMIGGGPALSLLCSYVFLSLHPL
jgi:E3 Ubiquitin ligase